MATEEPQENKTLIPSSNETTPNGVKGASPPTEGVKLKKTITLLNGITIIVGSIIGSGIFISPKGVQQEVGSIGLSLIVWIVGGVFSMFGAYCYAELGTLISESGADYAYITAAFGKFIAFIRLWVECIVVRPVTLTLQALTFSAYVVYPIFEGCNVPPYSLRFLATICLLTIIFINCYSVRLSTRVQDLFTYAKLFALALIILTGFVRIFFEDGRDSFSNPFAGSKLSPGSFALATYVSLYAYSGWNYLNFVIEEMVNVRRDLPIAIGVSLPLVTAVYVLANAAYYTTVSPTELLASPAVAVTFAKKLYGPAWLAVPIFVSLSCFGGVNGTLFTASRLFFVGGRHGHMPQLMSMVQVNRATPPPAVLFVGFLAIAYMYISSEIYMLMTYLSFVNWLAIGVSVACLFVLRTRSPYKEKYNDPNIAQRPIRVSLIFPIVYVGFSIFLVALPLYASPFESFMGLLVTLSAVPVYCFGVLWKRKPRGLMSKFESLVVFLQKILLMVPEDQKAN